MIARTREIQKSEFIGRVHTYGIFCSKLRLSRWDQTRTTWKYSSALLLWIAVAFPWNKNFRFLEKLILLFIKDKRHCSIWVCKTLLPTQSTIIAGTAWNARTTDYTSVCKKQKESKAMQYRYLKRLKKYVQKFWCKLTKVILPASTRFQFDVICTTILQTNLPGSI